MQSLARFAVILIGVVSLLNSAWIFGSVPLWFGWVPGVADTGAPNAHFVRDLGLVYGLFGGALIWVMREPARRHAVFVLAGLFYAGHALDHVAEILGGALPAAHWWVDFPLVFLPGLLLAVLALPKVWTAVFPVAPPTTPDDGVRPSGSGPARR